MDYKLFWTDEAINNLEDIIDYLQFKWTQKEVNAFKTKLSKQINLICSNPHIFPLSEYNTRLRKAVLSKHTSIFYELKNDNIYITYLFVNKRDIDSIK